MLGFDGVAFSHAGLVRQQNQDAGFLGPHCALVADGVGGQAAGEVASATAAYAVSSVVRAHPWADPVSNLHAGVRLAQEQVATGVSRDDGRRGMASTLTAVATDGHRFAMAHVGDSRGYLLRDGRLQRLTRDHTVVQQLMDDGTLHARDVERHPWRNVILRSVNGDPVEGGDVVPLLLHPDDRLVLASDGLTDLVGQRTIETVLERYPDDQAAQLLVDSALDAGGRDNVTCVVATVVELRDRDAEVSGGTAVGALRDLDNVVDPGAVRLAR